MNSYKPATPRTTLGVIACALTAATFGLFVAGPTLLVAQGDFAAAAGPSYSVEAATDSVRVLPSIDVVATREGPANVDRIRVVEAPRKVQS
jgi:hypothetical protein